jgi:hypothetical protein
LTHAKGAIGDGGDEKNRPSPTGRDLGLPIAAAGRRAVWLCAERHGGPQKKFSRRAAASAEPAGRLDYWGTNYNFIALHDYRGQ